MLHLLLQQEKEKTQQDKEVCNNDNTISFYLIEELEQMKVAIPLSTTSFKQSQLSGAIRERMTATGFIIHECETETEWVNVNDTYLIQPTALCIQFVQLSRVLKKWLFDDSDATTTETLT